MKSSKILSALVAYTSLSYLIDVPLRRSLLAKKSRDYADNLGKPLLNIGAGTDGTALFGSTLYGDVNIDINGQKDINHGKNVVTYADAEDLSEFDDGQFGAVFASHILEHLPNPEKALREWSRVVGSPEGLFVITPSWWAPHTWLHPYHLWYATDNRGTTNGGHLVKIRNKASYSFLPLRGY